MTAPTFVSETRERFLKAILAQLPLERVRELYLFPPIKQGGVESGVAVVAGAAETASGVGSGESGAPLPPAPEGHDAAEPPVVDLDAMTGKSAEALACEIPHDEAPDAGAGEDAAPDPRPPTPDPLRYTVYSARYRLVLKGPDRGKWEASVVAEADAPLVSIESVVRGVQRRAGDVEGPDHMTADDVRAALRLGPPASAA